MSSAKQSKTDVVGLETEVSLRVMSEWGVDVDVIHMEDWRRTQGNISNGPSRVVCQRAVGRRGVALLVAPDLYRQARGS